MPAKNNEPVIGFDIFYDLKINAKPATRCLSAWHELARNVGISVIHINPYNQETFLERRKYKTKAR